MADKIVDGSTWPLYDGSFDLLGDFDQAASLDLLGAGLLEPLNPADLHDSVGNTAHQASSGEGSDEQQMYALAPQQTDRKAEVKELNRRAQKRHRDKQKASPLQHTSARGAWQKLLLVGAPELPLQELSIATSN